MAYVAPRTWSSGEKPTAAQFNQDIRDNVSFLANPPACYAYRTTNQSINNNSLTVVLFDAERFDTNTMHDTSSNTSRITFNTAGIYQIDANIIWGADTDYTRRIMDIFLNNTTLICRRSDESTHSVANPEGWTLSLKRKFAVNDYIELRVFQTNTSAGANNLDATVVESAPGMSATWVGLG